MEMKKDKEFLHSPLISLQKLKDGRESPTLYYYFFLFFYFSRFPP